MDALCLDILNSDWHDYRGTRKDEDLLLKPGWLEQVVARWRLAGTTPLTADNVAQMQALRTLMQRIVRAFLEQQFPTEQDIAALDAYLDAAPTRPHLIRKDEGYQLQQVPLRDDWQRVLAEVAFSFATLLAEHDPTRLKQCSNPDCRWIYYDESPNQTRRWCEESCANLMRVRKYRTHHASKPL